MKITDLLQLIKPEQKPKKAIHALRTALIWGITVCLVLFLIRPFGLSDNDRLKLFYVASGYGLITCLIVFCNLVFIKRVLKRHLSGPWSFSNELMLSLLILLQISIFNFLYATVMTGEFSFSFISFMKLFSYTASLIIPLFVVKTAFELILNYSGETVKLETKLAYFREINKFRDQPMEKATPVTFVFDNGVQELFLEKIILVTAWGNYIKILLSTHDGKLELVNRGRIKDIENQLEGYPEFQRCHRSYIINVNYISTVRGNSKTANVIMKKDGIAVPISRDKIKNYLSVYSK